MHCQSCAYIRVERHQVTHSLTNTIGNPPGGVAGRPPRVMRACESLRCIARRSSDASNSSASEWVVDPTSRIRKSTRHFRYRLSSRAASDLVDAQWGSGDH